MTTYTYEKANTDIIEMCNIPDGITRVDLIKRIGAIQHAAERAMPANIGGKVGAKTGKRQSKPKGGLTKAMLGRFRAFWGFLTGEQQEYLLHVYATVGRKEYKYSDLYTDNPAGLHKAISERAKKANIRPVVTNNGQVNGHRRYTLTDQLCKFIEQDTPKVAAAV